MHIDSILTKSLEWKDDNIDPKEIGERPKKIQRIAYEWINKESSPEEEKSLREKKCYLLEEFYLLPLIIRYLPLKALVTFSSTNTYFHTKIPEQTALFEKIFLSDFIAHIKGIALKFSFSKDSLVSLERLENSSFIQFDSQMGTIENQLNSRREELIKFFLDFPDNELCFLKTKIIEKTKYSELIVISQVIHILKGYYKSLKFFKQDRNYEAQSAISQQFCMLIQDKSEIKLDFWIKYIYDFHKELYFFNEDFLESFIDVIQRWEKGITELINHYLYMETGIYINLNDELLLKALSEFNPESISDEEMRFGFMRSLLLMLTKKHLLLANTQNPSIHWTLCPWTKAALSLIMKSDPREIHENMKVIFRTLLENKISYSQEFKYSRTGIVDYLSVFLNIVPENMENFFEELINFF